MTKTTKQQQH